MNKTFWILPIIALGLVSQIAYAGSAPQAWNLGAWSYSTSYPTNISSQSCSISNSYIYCVGGFNGTAITNATYFAQTTSSGIGNWTQTTSYPFYIVNGACTTYQNYIYCVGGVSTGETAINDVFYAPINASGIGNWTQTTGYPFPVSEQSCSTHGGNVYCVGGSNNYNNTDEVYFAGLSSKGIGDWSTTDPYPINVDSESCVVNSTYLYCLGGIGGLSPFRFLNESYYTMLTSSGVSPWLTTTQYPNLTSDQSCAASNGYIYCTGGYWANITANYTSIYSAATYYAPLSASGIGPWLPTTSYPSPSDGASCNSYGNNVYCIGGAYADINTNISIIAPVINPNLPSSTTVQGTTITQVSGNSSQTATVTVQQQPAQGNGLVYLIIIFLVLLVLLMLLALYLFNKNRPASKR